MGTPSGHELCGLRYFKDEMVAVQNKQGASFHEIHLPSRPVMIRVHALSHRITKKKTDLHMPSLPLKGTCLQKYFFLTKYFEKVVHQ
jgi:hypothetical protein